MKILTVTKPKLDYNLESNTVLFPIKYTNKYTILDTHTAFRLFECGQALTISGLYVKLANHGKNPPTLHRWLMQPPDYLEVDHINKDTLDNRIVNLRIVRPSLNRLNTKVHFDNQSNVKGVCWDASRNKWMVRGCFNYKTKHLGRYDTLEEAEAVAKAYYAEMHAKLFTCV